MENTTAMSDDLRYPIGDFDWNNEITPQLRREFIEDIRNLPKNLAKAVEGLSEEQLETPYRPEGWTVRQTVHHVADSHINSFCRFKLALTEAVPTIKPYDEASWAKLSDSKMPVEISLQILEGVHQRLTNLLESLTDEDYQRQLNHPESGVFTVEKLLALYSWHSRHHTAHITKLRERNGW